MENMQSEIIFIAKFGGLIFAACTHYFYVIKPLAIFNERQKMNRKDIDKLQKDFEEINKAFTVLKTQHDGEMCKRKKK